MHAVSVIAGSAKTGLSEGNLFMRKLRHQAIVGVVLGYFFLVAVAYASQLLYQITVGVADAHRQAIVIRVATYAGFMLMLGFVQTRAFSEKRISASRFVILLSLVTCIYTSWGFLLGPSTGYVLPGLVECMGLVILTGGLLGLFQERN